MKTPLEYIINGIADIGSGIISWAWIVLAIVATILALVVFGIIVVPGMLLMWYAAADYPTRT